MSFQERAAVSVSVEKTRSESSVLLVTLSFLSLTRSSSRDMSDFKVGIAESTCSSSRASAQLLITIITFSSGLVSLSQRLDPVRSSS